MKNYKEFKKIYLGSSDIAALTMVGFKHNIGATAELLTFNEDGLTITVLGNNVYRAINKSVDITAEITPIDEYSNRVRCIEYKRADKNGRYRKTTKLLQHYLSWLDYILEEKGFIRKKMAR